MLSKEILEEYYIRQGLTLKQIGELFHIVDSTVLWWMKKYNIPRRSRSEALKEKSKSDIHKQHLRESSAIRWSRKEEHEKTSQSTKKAMADPVFRITFLEAQKNRRPKRFFKPEWSKKSREKMKELRKDKTYEEVYGYEEALKIKEKQLKVHKGKKLGSLSEKHKQKIREKALQRIQTHHGPYKDTPPELKMKEILNDLSIKFEHQFRLSNHLYDFRISNTNILIEVDGDYWHGNTKKYSTLTEKQLKQKERDVKNAELAKANNYILLRFWESDILKNTEEVKNELKKFCWR